MADPRARRAERASPTKPATRLASSPLQLFVAALVALVSFFGWRDQQSMATISAVACLGALIVLRFSSIGKLEISGSSWRTLRVRLRRPRKKPKPLSLSISIVAGDENHAMFVSSSFSTRWRRELVSSRATDEGDRAGRAGAAARASEAAGRSTAPRTKVAERSSASVLDNCRNALRRRSSPSSNKRRPASTARFSRPSQADSRASASSGSPSAPAWRISLSSSPRRSQPSGGVTETSWPPTRRTK